MTPNELARQVKAYKDWIDELEKDGEVTEIYDPTPDLFEALELLETSLEKLEFVIRVDGDVGFLSVEERAALMHHTAEVLTFTDLWKNEPDATAVTEDVKH